MFIGVSIATILLPGPAVILTLNNAIQRGLKKTIVGILGISTAILCIAVLSATSIGVLLASSVLAFTVVKIIGAIYLIYLGIKMFRSKTSMQSSGALTESSFKKCFLEGFGVSISNPKAVVFFMSIFPQFINLGQAYTSQFILLACTFAGLVLVIHSTYALFASIAKNKLASGESNNLLGKISGTIFVFFGLGLAVTSR